MNVISFDTATKSLAISIIKYNTNFSDDLTLLYNNYKANQELNIKHLSGSIEAVDNYNKLLQDTIKLVDERIQIKYLDVIDLIPDQKVSDTDVIYRTEKLYNFMNHRFDKILKDHVTDNESMIFLLEYQMGPNVKSNAISTQLIYHLAKYISYSNYVDIKLVGPSLKNKVYIGGDENKHSEFIEKYKTNYAANKNHTKHNFLKLIAGLNKQEMIKDINKKNIDDIADSVFMSLAFVIKNYDFNV